MTCRDFERLWNELIDEGVGATGNRQSALLEHAAACPACGQVSLRYQTLQRAIRRWGPPPVPSVGLADRVLAEIQGPRPRVWAIATDVRRRPRDPVTRAMIAAFATAAAAMVIGLPLLNRSMERTRLKGPRAVLHATPVESVASDTPTLNHAVAQATEATWDLARSASEPAARISREMLDAATGQERNPAHPVLATGSERIAVTVAVPSLDTLTPDTAAAGAMLQQVGDRLTTGVRPLSDTARHAFGFLFGPAPSKPEARDNLPAQKGA